MKRKIEEVENANVCLKYIYDKKTNEKDKMFNMSVCYIKNNNNNLAFRFSFSYLRLYIKDEIVEVIFDCDKCVLSLISLPSNEKCYINYSEKLHSNKCKSLDIKAFYDYIGNSLYHFYLIKETFERSTKFILTPKLNFIMSILDIIPSIDKINSFESSIMYYRDILEKKSLDFKEYKDYYSLTSKIDDLIEKTKEYLYRNIIITIKDKPPNFNIEIKNNKIHFVTYNSELYYFSNENLTIKITYDPFLIRIKYSKLKNDIFITFKTPSEFSLEYIKNYHIIYRQHIIFFGLCSSNSSNLFGIEKGNKYTYIGNYQNDVFNGIGLFISNSYVYRGNFIKGNKNDSNCIIITDKGNHQYKGGIENNELKGKGKYVIVNEKSIEGNFNKGELDGKCKFIYNNKDTYEGEMNNGVAMGEWKYVNANKKIEMKVNFPGDNSDIIYKY